METHSYLVFRVGGAIPAEKEDSAHWHLIAEVSAETETEALRAAIPAPGDYRVVDAEDVAHRRAFIEVIDAS